MTLVTLGNMGMPGNNRSKMIVSLWRNLRRLSAGKKSTSSFTFYLTYLLQRSCKPVVLGTLSMPGYAHYKWYYHLIENFYVYLQAKNQLHPPCFYGDIAKIWNLFGYFGHVWLHSPKMTVSPCRILQCLSACKKQTSSFTSFVRYYNLENPANWLADSILAHNPTLRILPDMVVKYQ